MKHTTSEHEDEQDICDCPPTQSIPFLDTSLSIENGQIEVDLYRKPSDRNQYLLTNSCHPPDCFKSIPYSLSLRIIRICTKIEQRDSRLQELKQYLIDRKYKNSLIEAAMRRALKIPRHEAIKRVAKQNTTKRPFLRLLGTQGCQNSPV